MNLRDGRFCVSTLALLLLFGTLSCGQPDSGDREAYPDVETASAEDFVDVIPRTSEPPPLPDQATPLVRKLVKTGSLGVEVADVDAAAARVKSLVDSLGGYVAAESSTDYGRATRHLTLKLPAADFELALPRLEAVGRRVTSRDIQVVDKTAEYVDVAARLQTQRALAARLRKLLDRANKVADVIEVERELTRVTADVEAFEARLKTIDRAATYATLEVTLRGDGDTAVAASFLDELGGSLGFGVDFLRAAVLGIVALWPLWLAVVPAVIWWRRRRRTRAARLDTL